MGFNSAFKGLMGKREYFSVDRPRRDNDHLTPCGTEGTNLFPHIFSWRAYGEIYFTLE